MQNEILIDILGFDPNQSDEDGSRSNVYSLDTRYGTVPPQIQEEFSSYNEKWLADLKLGLVRKIIPEKLFRVRNSFKAENIVERWYHGFDFSFNPNDHPFTSDLYLFHNRFPDFARASFERENGIWTPASIMLHGEGKEPENSVLTFLGDRNLLLFDSLGTGLCFDINNRAFDTNFDQKGAITALNFAVRRYEGHNLYDNIHLRKSAFERLAKGEILSERKGSSKYVFSGKDGIIKMERSENNKVEDYIQIPFVLNREELIAELFDPKLLDDPINAPLELDKLWNSVDLVEACGIDWVRY